MARIHLAVTNDLVADQRMDRICTTLQEAGHEVCLIGRQLPDSPDPGKRTYATRRMRLFFTRGKLFYLEYNLRLAWLLLFIPTDLLVANDLDTLLASWLAATLRRKPLIYDSHEYFTELPELITRPMTRSVWLRLERWIFPLLKYVYTVSDSIARAYTDRYKIPVRVIRNLPLVQPAPAGTAGRNKVLMYQGSLNVGRGLELMVQTLALLPEYRLVIAGRGDFSAKLEVLARESGVNERVHFTGFLQPEALRAYTREARIGLSLEEDMGENYRFALPNKLFDYIQARVPVIVSDLPEMRAICDQYQVGLVLPTANRTPHELAALVRQVDSGYYETWVSHCDQAAARLNWEQEKGKLLEIYALAFEA